MSPLYSDAIFWIEVDKIRPNPYQPRREFDQRKLEDLAESIRQYGVLQPLVVTRHEHQTDDGGLQVEYELIAGERRLRASRIAGVEQVPVVIRTGEEDSKLKLELAIIENLQREDLNPVDRAKAFQRFIDDFGYTHNAIAKKMGKSREYVSNSLRLLALPGEILDALADGRITEGHARPLMMLRDKPEEQMTVFKEIVMKKLTVREAEGIARRIAKDKIRKRSRDFDPEILAIEKNLTENLGTRVHIEPKEVGGKIMIDFFNEDDLRKLMETLKGSVATAGAAARFSGEIEDVESDQPEEQKSAAVEQDSGDVYSSEETHVENVQHHEVTNESRPDSHEGADLEAEEEESVSHDEEHTEVTADSMSEREETATLDDAESPMEEAFDAMIEGETTDDLGVEGSTESAEAPPVLEEMPVAETEPIPEKPMPMALDHENDLPGIVSEASSHEVAEATPVRREPLQEAPQMPVPPKAPEFKVDSEPEAHERSDSKKDDTEDEDLYAVRNFSL